MNAELHPSLAASLLKRILNRRPMSFACVDETLRIRLAGPQLETFLETPVRDLMGAYLPDVFVEFVGLEEVLLAIIQGQALPFHLAPVERETKEGTRRYLSFEFSRLDEGEWPGLLLIEDITRDTEPEQRLLQERNELRLLRAQLSRANAELQRLNRFKSAILSMAAHDLRSPLSVIKNVISMVFPEAQTETSRELLEHALSSANRLHNLIIGLLDQDRAEQGKLVLRRQTLDLVALLQEVIRMMHPLVIPRIHLDAPPEGIELKADLERLQQVFYNLIDNAIKYTPSDQPVIVRAEHRDGWALVQISDRGRGMSPEEVAQLFQMYYRTEGAKSSLPGTGLGLFIVKALVEAHGGRVEVQSQIGQGTTFRVYLPMTSQDG